MSLKTPLDQRNGRAALVAAQDPRSAAAEAYRTLRTNLRFSALDRDLRTILVTSAGAGDGKTSVVANLAVAVAEEGRSILLVDCDLRRPGLHAIFGLPQAPGLTNALTGEALEGSLLPTSVPRLTVLPAGDAPPNPAEFVASARLAKLLDRLRSTADVVLIDSPPIGLVADAAVLAPKVDGVILVLRAGRTKRDLALRAKTQLDSAGARILGTVLNDARLEKRLRDYHAMRDRS